MGKSKVDIHHEVKQQLRSLERFGESKYEAKKAGTMKDGIYSYDTARAYNKACQAFAEYVREQAPMGRHTTLEEARAYARGFISREIEQGKSPYTVKLERAALGKLYGCKGTEFGEVPNRSRDSITRSRERVIISEKTGKEILNPRTRAGHFSEKNNAAVVSFAKSTGLRRSELEALKGDQLRLTENGYAIAVKGKGGRERLAPVRGDVNAVVERMRAAGSSRVFEKVPAAMDVHHYRSVYASELYKEHARAKDEIPRDKRYCCRGELKGTWYDRDAMKYVSEALGHSRVSVIAEHYLR